MSKITRETLRQMIAEEIARASKPEPEAVKVTAEQLRNIILQEVRQLSEQDDAQVIDAEGSEIVSTPESRALIQKQQQQLKKALNAVSADNDRLPDTIEKLDELLSVAEAPEIGVLVAHFVNQQSLENVSPENLAKLQNRIERKAARIQDSARDVTSDKLRVRSLVKIFKGDVDDRLEDLNVHLDKLLPA